jgi:hypothetical protein
MAASGDGALEGDNEHTNSNEAGAGPPLNGISDLMQVAIGG